MCHLVDHKLVDPEIVADGANTLADMRLMVTGSAAMPVSVNEKWKNLTGHTLLEVRDEVVLKSKNACNPPDYVLMLIYFTDFRGME